MDHPKKRRKTIKDTEAQTWSDCLKPPSASHPPLPKESHSPAAQPHCRLFLLPAELRNEIYLLVAESNGLGLLRGNKRDKCTSSDPMSLTCKYIRHEYLDVLSKKARTLVACTAGAVFCNTLLLRHELADPKQQFAPSRRKRASRTGKRRADAARLM